MMNNSGTMMYVCDVEDGLEASMEVFLQNYTENIEPVMTYSSKDTYVKEQKMLITEGFLYTASSGLVSIVLGVLVSVLFAGTIANNLWFFSYQFTLIPILMTIPILLIIGILLPILVLKSVEKQSIVDRLREAEA